jgi:uncharacterized membrane protein
MTPDERILPAHIEDTVGRIARLHAEHLRESSALQRAIGATTSFIGRPIFVGGVTAAIGVWIAANLAAAQFGRPIDPAPFYWLQGGISMLALYATLFILGTQQRDDILASQREQLTLELAILSEQKSAKIIQLLEDLRRDHPDIENRIDAEALTMSFPTDPQVVLDAIKESQPGNDEARKASG